MWSREEFERRAKAAKERADEVKARLGITVKVYITDWEEKLKGNDVHYPIEDVPPEELKERLFKMQTMAMQDYAASIGATLEIVIPEEEKNEKQQKKKTTA